MIKNDRIHVATISPEYPPYICGGLGVHVDQITASMCNSVFFQVLVPKKGGYKPYRNTIQICEISVSDSQSYLGFWLSFCRNIIHNAKNCRFSADILNCHDWMTILAGIGLRKMFCKPLVYNVHLPQSSKAHRIIENIGIVTADLVIVNSNAVFHELVSRGLPINQIETIPNGVDLQAFHPTPDLPINTGHILFVGRLVPQKGIDVLLQAFSIALQKYPNNSLVIVGDGELELYLKRIVRNIGIPHKVSFVKWQSGSTLVRFYQKAKIVVVPSLYEPFGIVALEAMACGKPVIASKTGGLMEIIEDGINGFLIKPGDHLQLAKRIAYLLQYPEMRHQIGKNARARATMFSWKSIGKLTMSYYQKMRQLTVKQDQSELANQLFDQLLSEVDEISKPILVDIFHLIQS